MSGAERQKGSCVQVRDGLHERCVEFLLMVGEPPRRTSKDSRV